MSDQNKKMFDAVVMLTASDWKTELRSNRYHYAKRFAKHYPVIFVQPDLYHCQAIFEATELENVTILHVWKFYNENQAEFINQALLQRNITRPLLWIYNPQFVNYVENRNACLVVYHGTEDYLLSNSTIQFKENSILYKKMLALMTVVDLLVCVSEGVEEGFMKVAKYQGKKIIVSNGCDYKFYAPMITEESFTKMQHDNKIVFYQGNIFNKLNYALLETLILNMPDWQFQFCGRVLFNEAAWKKLLDYPNVNYLGILQPEQLREYAYKATVGIIPFEETEWLVERSLPLKAFEYLACGLPVVTIPIRSLTPYSNVFNFASTAQEFEIAIREAAIKRFDQETFTLRLQEASKQDYDHKFSVVLNQIQKIMNTAPVRHRPINHTFSELPLWLCYLVGNKSVQWIINNIPNTLKKMIREKLM